MSAPAPSVALMHRRPARAPGPRSGFAGLRRALRRRRRALALLALLLAGAAILPSFAPAPARTAPVVVAARDLPTGHLVVESDLRTVEVPVPLRPSGALASVDSAAGHRLAAPIPDGGALTGARLRDGADPSVAPGHALLAVPVDTPLVRHITVGSDVELVVPSLDPQSPRKIPATVVETGDSAGDTAFQGAAGMGADGASQAMIVVAVDASDAPAIAHATREGWVVTVPVG